MKRMLFNATQAEELRVAIVDGQKLDRPRHRIRQQRTTQEQHLQGCHHPRRAQPGGRIRRLRLRAPRLPAVQGNLPRLLQPERRPRPHPGSPERRPGTDRPGRKGRARQQGRGAHHLHLAGRPLPRADAEQPARRRRLAPHRGRGTQRTARHHGAARDSRGHEPDRPHRRHRPHRRRIPVGPELPAAAVESHRRRVHIAKRRLPDLPGRQPGDPRHPRLLLSRTSAKS